MITALTTYFPDLTIDQQEKFSRLPELYREWNAKINVVSRKDIDMLMLHHVLHSLSIAKVISFKDGTRIIDVGTGGGFPGIPLAIMFPQCEFLLVDSTGKKINVVNEIASALKLENVVARKERAEELDETCDFVISRAVSSIGEIYHWTKKLIVRGKNNSLPNGWIFLKGGDLKEEILASGLNIKEFEISSFFSEDFFLGKKVLYGREG